MPLSVVTFTTKNPTGIHVALLEVLKNEGYNIFLNKKTKIIADHSASLTQDYHAIKIEFTSKMPKDTCAPTTVTLKIDDIFSSTYIKSIVDKLLELTQDVTIISTKPEIKFGNQEKELPPSAANPACMTRDPASIMKGKWECQICGAQNTVRVNVCQECGATRRTTWEPASPAELRSPMEEIDAHEEENNDNDDRKSIY